MWWLLLGIVIAAGIFAATRLFPGLRTPQPSPVLSGGVITWPGFPGTVLPVGATVSYMPLPPWTGPVGGRGQPIRVTVTSMSNQPIPGVQVVASIGPGRDAGVTSYIDMRITLPNNTRVKGTELQTITNPGGIAGFLLRGNADGDEDELTIVVGTGTSTETVVYRYQTRR